MHRRISNICVLLLSMFVGFLRAKADFVYIEAPEGDNRKFFYKELENGIKLVRVVDPEASCSDFRVCISWENGNKIFNGQEMYKTMIERSVIGKEVISGWLENISLLDENIIVFGFKTENTHENLQKDISICLKHFDVDSLLMSGTPAKVLEAIREGKKLSRGEFEVLFGSLFIGTSDISVVLYTKEEDVNVDDVCSKLNAIRPIVDSHLKSMTRKTPAKHVCLLDDVDFLDSKDLPPGCYLEMIDTSSGDVYSRLHVLSIAIGVLEHKFTESNVLDKLDRLGVIGIYEPTPIVFSHEKGHISLTAGIATKTEPKFEEILKTLFGYLKKLRVDEVEYGNIIKKMKEESLPLMRESGGTIQMLLFAFENNLSVEKFLKTEFKCGSDVSYGEINKVLERLSDIGNWNIVISPKGHLGSKDVNSSSYSLSDEQKCKLKVEIEAHA